MQISQLKKKIDFALYKILKPVEKMARIYIFVPFGLQGQFQAPSPEPAGTNLDTSLAFLLLPSLITI